eukprot:365259-Chlamydomonas_euryale.AAC.3
MKRTQNPLVCFEWEWEQVWSGRDGPLGIRACVDVAPCQSALDGGHLFRGCWRPSVEGSLPWVVGSFFVRGRSLLWRVAFHGWW